MKYVIGFDGGGTKTRCVLGDDQGNVLADIIGGPSNHQTIGIKATKEVLHGLYREVLKIQKLKEDEIDFIFLGLAGADLPSDFELLNCICTEMFGSIKFEVVNDAWIIMRSGTRDPFGAVSIYGTGANAGAINHKGEMYILRALNYHLGGAGGGGDIASDALHYMFRSNEKTFKYTLLEVELPPLFACSTVEELLDHLYPVSKVSYEDMIKIPPLVFSLASRGDEVCQKILADKGRLQGEMLNGVLTQSNMIGTEFPVVLGGSIYKGSSPEFIESFKKEVLEYSPQASFIFAELEPVAGAYIFALDRIGHSYNEIHFKRIQKSLKIKNA